MLLGALLSAAPVFSQAMADPHIKGGQFVWFTLSESRAELTTALGRPAVVADFGHDFVSWQYQLGNIDHHDFSHQVVMRRDGAIVSITRNYEPERNVDALFPENETTTHEYAVDGKPQFSVRVRRLSGGRLLLAMGVSKPGQKTYQLMLIRESEVRYFHPWLAEQLRKS